MSGYSFNGRWNSAESLFWEPAFQRRYDRVRIFLLTPKVALVPEAFFEPQRSREILSDTVRLQDNDVVEWVRVPQFGAVLVYSNSIGESLSKVVSQTVLPVSGEPAPVLPEMYSLLEKLPLIEEYNKIILSWSDGWLHLAIAQGKTLLLANVFPAKDFVTAQYYLFLAVKQLQLNPELSTVFVSTPVDHESVMSLYRYFKAVVCP